MQKKTMKKWKKTENCEDEDLEDESDGSHFLNVQIEKKAKDFNEKVRASFRSEKQTKEMS